MEDAHTTWVGSYTVPSWVLGAFLVRGTYINEGELLAAPVVALIVPHLLRGRDIIWFIDNRAALAALIKGAAPRVDTSALALLASLSFTALGARLWYERVDSKGNPADVLSRDALGDPEVEARIRTRGVDSHEPRDSVGPSGRFRPS